ncbi:MFS transporter [Streptomyces mirabilis]|uniref:MFS transporter n=1 Tax=Streptomyces mirabilis TaxID=68239 RepID=UPI003322E0E7
MSSDRSACAGNAALALLCTAQLMLMIDFSVINLALPDIESSLDISTDASLWTATVYAISFGGLLPLGGRLADLVGRRRMFVCGLAVFGVASLVGGIAADLSVLIAMRAVQGGAAALTAPALLSLITTAFPEETARRRALGWFGASTAAGFSLGVVLGGVLTEFVSWRAVLLINVPLAALAVPLAFHLLGESGVQPPPRRYDIPGAVTATTGCATLLLGISEAGRTGWDRVSSALPLLLGVVMIGFFVVVERRSPAPLIPLHVFRIRSVSAVNTIVLFVTGVMGALTLLLSLLFRNVRLDGPLEAGVSVLPLGLVTAVVSQLTPRLATAFAPRRVLIAGVTVFAAGMLVLAMADGTGDYGPLLLGMIICGAGFGTFFTTAAMTATGDVPDADQGLASGLINTATQIGTALGIAFLVSLADRKATDQGVPTPADVSDGFSLAAQVAAITLAVVGGFALTTLRQPARPELVED